MRTWHPIVACAALISVEAAFAPASPAQAAPLLFMSPNPIVALAAEDPPGSVPFGFELTLAGSESAPITAAGSALLVPEAGTGALLGLGMSILSSRVRRAR